ncbi:hypothetical protein BGZ98_007111 [Dissophora globulifera]|nr:hypothetical protein BGZ98_007111 [Dissophora globulifera]
MPRQLGPEYVSLSSLTPGRDAVNINVRGIISEVIYKPFRVTESDKVYMTSFKLMDNVTRVEKRAMLFAPELNMLPLVRPKDYVLIRHATYDCNTKWGDVICALGGQGGLWMAVPQEFMDQPAHE